MKKYLIYIIAFVFLFLLTGFTIVQTDTYAKTEITTENELVNSNTVKSGNDSVVVEEQEVEEEPEEIETDNSTTDEYVEEDNYYTESYDDINYGSYGRLYVSGFSVALYDYNVNTNSSYSLQEIVDDYDSAAYYRNRGRLVIADHNYQGFSILGSLGEGTTAYIQFEDGSTVQYTLIRVSGGYNTGPDLVDYDGNSFFSMDSDLIMYTCSDDGIMATLWVLS